MAFRLSGLLRATVVMPLAFSMRMFSYDLRSAMVFLAAFLLAPKCAFSALSHRPFVSGLSESNQRTGDLKSQLLECAQYVRK